MDTKIIQATGKVKSSDDFELSITRGRDVDYSYSYPADKKVKGIVFIIPGFGEDTNSSYSQMLRDYIAKTFEVAAVHVIYHCFYSRFDIGAEVGLDKTDEEILLHHLKKYNLSITSRKIGDILVEIDKAIGLKKEEGTVDKDLKLLQTLSIMPKYGEYQNFGVLQAIDHINVLQDIRGKSLDFMEDYPTILMGSSHGGYIAYMAAKFAPNMFDCVIDNSSYVKPPLQYIVGKETDIYKAEFRQFTDNLNVHYFTKTYWSTDKESYFYFSKDRYDIRDLSNVNHLQTISFASNNKIKYISYHSKNDDLASVEDKVLLYKKLDELGFDTHLNVVEDESELDGKFIKSLSHGLGMSIKELANRELPDALKIRSKSGANQAQMVSLECETLRYEFQNLNGVFSAVQMPKNGIEERVVETYQKNIEYFKMHQNELYQKLASLDSAIEQELYENRYDLVYQNNYFDIKELVSDNYFYGSDSKKHAYEIATPFNLHVNLFIFFGVGLGLHISAIEKRVAAGGYLIVEDDIEVFRLSIFTTPYYELAEKSKLFFSVMDSEEHFLKSAEDFLNSTEDKSLLHCSMSNRHSDKVLSFKRLLGTKNG